jgi:ribosomal protein S21
MMIHVFGGDMERAIRDLRRFNKKDGLLQELKERSIGHKHSDLVKFKMRKARRLRLKTIKRIERNGNGRMQ